MNRLRLRHLTLIGAGVEPASIDFSDGLTAVTGPSDTGKSFIADAIDFMLGANALKEVPELRSYSTVLLGLHLSSGDVTLSRAVSGGGFGLHRGDVRRGPVPVPEQTLSATHRPGADSSLSGLLLGAIGLTDRRVRRNAKGDTNDLSFRNLAHLCVIDETRMQSEVPPALSGQYVTRTTEVSVLRLLLEDTDDSDVVAVPDRSERKAIGSAKQEVVERLIAEVEVKLGDYMDRSELLNQRSRLLASIEASTESIEGARAERSQLSASASALRRERDERQAEFEDASNLAARFGLLLDQYQSDLARLQMVREAGTLLGYFQAGVCAFCGADPEHQHLNEDCEGDETHFGVAVEAEVTKTTLLREDLGSTIEDVEHQQAMLQERLVEIAGELERLGRRFEALDEVLQPEGANLEELLARRSDVERLIGLHEQLADLQDLRSQLEVEPKQVASPVVASLNLSALEEFSAEISSCLLAWGVPDAGRVRYDRNEQDIVAGDQLRAAHGKGVRAVLHAAFSIALGRYCLDRELPHPGFLVLDSPLVTYRPPDLGRNDEPELDVSVVSAFYADLSSRSDLQTVLLENTEPPDATLPGLTDLRFTKSEGLGRYGFFPV
jgi:hypothetical protein